MRVAVITIAHGRHEHLENQRRALAASTLAPSSYTVVAMDDPAIREHRSGVVPVPSVVEVARHPLGLPLAAARNAGARAAVAAGTDLLVFLDVDCLPDPLLLQGYADAAANPDTSADLLCGPVAYLPPAPLGGYQLEALSQKAVFHPARPVPNFGDVERDGDHDLFWSLSFALTPATWDAIGGFHEEYVGYGGEDTDFGHAARRAGRSMTWVGGARAYHQHHPTTTPPVQHVDDIVRNGALFAERWGRWPMGGWLDEFERRGLVASDSAGGWRVVSEV